MLLRNLMIPAGAMAAAFLMAPSAASAQVRMDPGVSSDRAANIVDVQYRRGVRGGYRGAYRGGYRGGYRGYRGGYRYGYRGGYGGRAAVGAITGLAAGAIIGGALANQYQQPTTVYTTPDQSAVQYCINRFKSYDINSGTYLGYDGLRHACP